MAAVVDKTFLGHKEKTRKIYELISSTADLEREIERLLSAPVAAKLISQTEEAEIKDLLEQMSVVAVIGERNCGKSSLINALLSTDRRVVPVSDRTCTSRVVCIKYSEEPYNRLVDADGSTQTSSESLRQLVVLKSEDRENEELVSQIVEVGVNHPFLQCGVQIVDSPGRSENKILDQVVDRFALERNLPVLIYVIDGNNSLRPTDRASIQFFKDKCPEARLIYVCNKVDAGRRASIMDRGSDDESDEEDAIRGPYVDNLKASDVRAQLHEFSLLDARSGKETYHSMSTREVNNAKKANMDTENNVFLRDFETFRGSLVSFLSDHLNSLVLSATRILRECHSRCYCSFSGSQESIEKEDEEMSKALEATRSSENGLFSDLLREVDGTADKIMGVIREAVLPVSDEITKIKLKEQEIIAYDRVLLHRDVTNKYGGTIPRTKKFLKLHAFCHEIRNFIINTVSRKVETAVEGILEDLASSVWPSIVATLDVLDTPTLKRNLDSVYQFFGAESTLCRDTTRKALAGLVFSLLRAARLALSSEMQRVYSIVPIVDVALEIYKENAKRKVDQSAVAKVLVSKLNTDEVADRIVGACRDAVTENHRQFQESLQQIEMLKQQVQEQKMEHLGAIRSKVIFELAQIEIRNRALEFETISGEPTLGTPLSRREHCVVYRLGKEWGSADPDQFVVRVVEGSPDDWFKQTLCNLYCAMNCKENDYLTKVIGWLLPANDVVHIVMEKAEARLDADSLSPRQRLQVTLDVARGIDAIHTSGFIYNNLKTSNILMTKDSRAKINTCEGKCEVLHGQAANLDIEQIGELLLNLYGGEVVERGRSMASSLRMRRPTGCPANVMMLIDRCVARHKQITVKDIIKELQTMLE